MNDVATALQATVARLTAAGVEGADLDARLLVRAAGELTDADLITRGHAMLSAAARAELERMVERRADREPAAYILGTKEFWGLAFQVGPDVLVPRPESETLVEAALNAVAERRAEALSICDLGTGSGALIVALLRELPAARGTAVEMSAPALATARDNAVRHGVGDRVRLARADFSTFAGGPFDLVVANPPYIATGDLDSLAPEVARHEPRLALDGGADGLDAYRAITPRLPVLLKPGGAALLEVGSAQDTAVREMLHQQGLHIDPPAHDLSGVVRVVCCHASG